LQLGLAAEIRIGLDLAPAPGYWDLLSFLSPRECDALLRRAGYSTDGYEHLADTGTTDPLLLEWTRNSHPIALDDNQYKALTACWDMVQMQSLLDPLADHSAQLRRSFFSHLTSDMGRDNEARIRTDPVARALSHLWQGYVLHGRRQITRLGDRVVLSPRLAAGFGVADLVVGRSLVEIKTVLEPASRFGQWLNQLLGYILLDWFDTFRLNTVAVYLGWQAMLISAPIVDVIAAASSGQTTPLEVLRAEFRQAIKDDLDITHEVQLRKRYPPPIAPAQSTTAP
jgi:hypothetical protein